MHPWRKRDNGHHADGTPLRDSERGAASASEGAEVSVTGTGDASAVDGGTAVSGHLAQGPGPAGPVYVSRTGDAVASKGGVANTGVIYASMEPPTPVRTAARLARAVKEREGRQHDLLLGAGRQVPAGFIDLPFTAVTRLQEPPVSGSMGEVAAWYRWQRPDCLVITGTPAAAGRADAGAGKTVFQLRLVLGLLERRGPEDPVPVRLSAASWNHDEIRGWLRRHLASVYRLKPREASAVVDHDLVLPLIDGLDEISAPRSLMGAIGRYKRGGRACPVVLTCRRAEYEDLLGADDLPPNVTHLRIARVDAERARAFLLERVATSRVGLDRWRRVLDTLEGAERPGGPREAAALAAELDSPWHLTLSAIVFDERNRAGEYVRSPDELLRLAADGELHEYLLDRYVAAAVRLPYRGASGDEPDLARRLRLHAGSTWKKLAVLARYLQDNNRAPRIVSGMRLSGTDMVPNELWPLAGVRRVRRTEAVLAASCLALWSTVLVLVSHVALAITLAGVVTVAVWYFAPALRRLENRSHPAGAACDGLAFGTMTGAVAVAFGAGTLRGAVAAAAGAVLSGAVSWAERTALARIRAVRTPLRRPWPTALLKGTVVGLTALTVVGVGVSAADGPAAATGTAAVFSLGLGVVAGLEARAVAVLDTASLPRPGVRGLLTGLRWFAGLLVPLVALVIPLTGGVGRWALFLCILSASAGLGVGIGAGFATSTEAMEEPPVFWLLATAITHGIVWMPVFAIWHIIQLGSDGWLLTGATGLFMGVVGVIFAAGWTRLRPTHARPPLRDAFCAGAVYGAPAAVTAALVAHGILGLERPLLLGLSVGGVCAAVRALRELARERPEDIGEREAREARREWLEELGRPVPVRPAPRPLLDDAANTMLALCVSGIPVLALCCWALNGFVAEPPDSFAAFIAPFARLAVVLVAVALASMLNAVRLRYGVFLALTPSLSQLRPFLEECTALGLLRMSGDAYQFRHRELQEHLADRPRPPDVR